MFKIEVYDIDISKCKISLEIPRAISFFLIYPKSFYFQTPYTGFFFVQNPGKSKLALVRFFELDHFWSWVRAKFWWILADFCVKASILTIIGRNFELGGKFGWVRPKFGWVSAKFYWVRPKFGPELGSDCTKKKPDLNGLPFWGMRRHLARPRRLPWQQGG